MEVTVETKPTQNTSSLTYDAMRENPGIYRLSHPNGAYYENIRFIVTGKDVRSHFSLIDGRFYAGIHSSDWNLYKFIRTYEEIKVTFNGLHL